MMRKTKRALALVVIGIAAASALGTGEAEAQATRPLDTSATRLRPLTGGGDVIAGLGPVFKVPVSVSALDPALRSVIVRCEATSADIVFAGYGRLALSGGGASGFVTVQTQRIEGDGTAAGGTYQCLLMASTEATGDIPPSTEMVPNAAALLPSDYAPPAAGAACDGSLNPYCGVSDFLTRGGTTRIGPTGGGDAAYKVDPAGYSGLVQGSF